ncbi:MAG: aldo/keto reductase [Cyanobacteria bacterium J06607_10]
MKTMIELSSGQSMPKLGMGTWRMGENKRRFDDEVKALRHGLSLGLSLIDTAEMYGEGGAEEVVGAAIAGKRSDVFLVSKVYPHNASREGAIAACERSLKRLNTDYIDLYLLHWRGSEPLADTLDAFDTLKQAGKIRDYGVSNFDVDDMEEAIQLPTGKQIVTNQILYNLSRRGVEHDLLPWCKQQNVAVMAYSPIEQGRLLGNKTLEKLGKAKGVSGAQVAIAWLLHRENIIVIPKSSRIEHIEQNVAAQKIKLSPEDMAELDTAFPAPARPIPLQML